jgi:hypothetical protein
MITAADIAHRLEARRTGEGRWIARCPAHEDRSPSLGIRQASDRVLLYCWGGCPTEDVLRAAGLTWGDLFPERPDRRPTRPRATPPDPLRELRDWRDRVRGVYRDELLWRNRLLTAADRLILGEPTGLHARDIWPDYQDPVDISSIDQERRRECAELYLATALQGISRLEWIADLLDFGGPQQWREARDYLTGEGL